LLQLKRGGSVWPAHPSLKCLREIRFQFQFQFMSHFISWKKRCQLLFALQKYLLTCFKTLINGVSIVFCL
jgi:hypothetical protein